MSKYRAVKTVVDGIKFDSKAEARRFTELRAMEKAGEIYDLLLQPVFVLAPQAMIQGRLRPALRYVADFQYTRDGVSVVEDVKGVLTPVYRLKRHLMKSELDINIVEVK